MYTNSYLSNHESQYFVKFSDDTVLLFLITGVVDTHGKALDEFVAWRYDNFLELNGSKIEEIVFDFRRNSPRIP